MIIIRTPQEKIDAYFASPAINQSLLKEAEKGVVAFRNAKVKLRNLKNDNYYMEPSDSFLIGSGVDCLVTQGRDAFNLNYYTASEGIAKPSDAIMSIVKAVFDAVVVESEEGAELPSLSTQREKILLSVAAHNWNTRWTDDVKFNKISTEGASYWELLVDSRGKTILTLDEFTTINSISDRILTSDSYRVATQREDIVIFQFPVYFELLGISCKALLDMVTIKFRESQIHIYDFKTMSGSVLKFKDSMRKYRYDIQGAWYKKGLEEVLGRGEFYTYLTNYVSTEFENSLSGYLNSSFEVESVNFIVASSTNESQVVKYRMSKELLQIGHLGRPKSYYDSFCIEEGKVHLHLIPAVVGFKELLHAANSYETGRTLDIIPSRALLLDWDEARSDVGDANEG